MYIKCIVRDTCAGQAENAYRLGVVVFLSAGSIHFYYFRWQLPDIWKSAKIDSAKSIGGKALPLTRELRFGMPPIVAVSLQCDQVNSIVIDSYAEHTHAIAIEQYECSRTHSHVCWRIEQKLNDHLYIM